MTAEPKRFDVDPEHLSISFRTHHIGFADVHGMFLKGGGSFTFDESTKTVSDIRFTVDANSVFTNHKSRDKHIRSKDFLDAKNHPEIVFEGTGATISGERSGTVDGNLTIRGITKPITAKATWNRSGNYPFGAKQYVMGVTVEAVVKRSEYGIVYAVANGWVGDEVTLLIDLEAIRQE